MDQECLAAFGKELANRFHLWIDHPELRDGWLESTEMDDLSAGLSITSEAICAFQDSSPFGLFLWVLPALREMRDGYTAEAIRRGKLLHPGQDPLARAAGHAMAAAICRLLDVPFVTLPAHDTAN